MKISNFIFHILLLAMLFILFHPSPAYSHVLKTDGSIGAVIHINPEDEPIAGEPSEIFFELKDKTGSFRPEDCNCQLIVSQDSKQISSQVLTSPPNETATILTTTYTFPKRGIYHLDVIGKPVGDNSFQPFTLSYTVRVERETTASSTQTDEYTLGRVNPLYLIGSVLLIIVGILMFYQLRKKGVKR